MAYFHGTMYENRLFCSHFGYFLLPLRPLCKITKQLFKVSHSVNEKLPQECTNIDEVRNEINNIDNEIINLLAIRLGYVHEVVKYKEATDKAIEASERRATVIRTRRDWAAEKGLDPDVIEEVYKKLIQFYIDEEKKLVLKNGN